MFGRLEPCCVYGVAEPAQGLVLDAAWLEHHFQGYIGVFGRWASRLRAEQVVYGVLARWDEEEGCARVDEESSAAIHILVSVLDARRARRGSADELQVGFFLALQGDSNLEELVEYTPEEEPA